jgi:hypothetical protein
MFGNFFKAAKSGATGAKAIHVLSKTYSLEISHSEHLEMMRLISMEYAGIFNEFEMAVQFLSQFSNSIKVDHPKAKSEIKKYIRMSKGLYKHGLATDKSPLEDLFKVARDRFNIEPNEIDSA